MDVGYLRIYMHAYGYEGCMGMRDSRAIERLEVTLLEWKYECRYVKERSLGGTHFVIRNGRS